MPVLLRNDGGRVQKGWLGTAGGHDLPVSAALALGSHRYPFRSRLF